MVQLVNTPHNKQGRIYTAPSMYMKQVPMCCSCEVIHNISSVPFSSSYPSLKVHSTKTDPFDKFVDCITSVILTKEGVSTSAAALLAHRILKCENPYVIAPKLRDIAKQDLGGRIDNYHWPVKIWTMYDRNDVKTPRRFTTRTFACWMEENAAKLGMKIHIIDGPSVHALGSSYSCFDSEKPDGYGTMRVWVMVVEDTEKLEKWYNNAIESIINAAVYTDKPEGENLW